MSPPHLQPRAVAAPKRVPLARSARRGLATPLSRRLAQWLFLLLFSSVSVARGAASVVVPTFAAPADLAIFGPEVARAVASSLAKSGVEVGPGGVLVAGRIESLGPERVRLVASVAGKSAQVDGPVEEIDRLAVELSARLLPLLPLLQASPRHATNPAHAGATPAAVKTTPAAPPPTVVAAAAPAPATAPPATAPPTTAPHRPSRGHHATTPPIAAKPPVAAAPATTSPPPPPPPVVTPPPPPAPIPPATTTPASTGSIPPPPLPVPATAAAPIAPIEPSYESMPPPPPPPVVTPPPLTQRAPGRFQPVGRAILHVVRTPTGCASGEWATQAAREVLDHIQVQTVLGGCGLAPIEVAMAEAVRAGVSAVVMTSIDRLRFEPVDGGLLPVGRVRVIVVRDGRVVLLQAPELSTRALHTADMARAAYDLTAAAFSRLAGPLQAVLIDR